MQLEPPMPFNMTVVSVFAAIALSIAAVGSCGVSGFSVTRRTREIGIRVAMGARRGEILKHFLARCLPAPRAIAVDRAVVLCHQ